MENINKGMLHRAFSCFIFNSEGKLLLQQRSDSKITFPGYWTNTCCSHPLHFDEEIEAENQIGVRRAVRRKLDNELGIKPEFVDIDAMQFMTRIHYIAPSDGIWGEHEMDYIMFLKADIPIVPNPEEVKAVRYVSQEELRQMMEQAAKGEIHLTPWFALISDSFIWKWWDALLNGTLSEHKDNEIHHMNC